MFAHDVGAGYDSPMTADPEKLEIVLYPHPALRGVAEPVGEIDDSIRAIVKKMIELMHEAPGVGLAAPQVGLPLRMFVANPTGEQGDDRVYINPQLVNPQGPNAPREEGCLSLPGINVEVRRPSAITIRATDEQGQPFEDSADDLLARIWQHEYDHLQGVLIIDNMSMIDRMANRRAIRELEGV